MEEQRSEEKQYQCQEVGLAQGCGGEVTGVHWGGHGGAVGRSQGCNGEVAVLAPFYVVSR